MLLAPPPGAWLSASLQLMSILLGYANREGDEVDKGADSINCIIKGRG